MADNETSIEKPPFYIRHFFLILVLLGILGGFLALTVPLWKSWAEAPKTNCIEFILGWIGSPLSSLIPNHDDEKYPQGKVITDLRLHILYITGGIIAILTLLQTDWKNQVDRRKVEDDIQKNKNDHDRQVHAERRGRYAKAIEQLADDKAAIRLGGIYTLVGLIDEWLADDSLEPDERQKEGQVIINNLCAYIRSPISLSHEQESIPAENTDSPKPVNNNDKNFAIIKVEHEVRESIINSIKERLNSQMGDNKKPTEGPWSNFIYNFRGANFPYSVDFSKVYFSAPTNFAECTFSDANFKNSIFAKETVFENSVFANSIDFSYSESINGNFKGTCFCDSTFKGAVFTGANLENAIFIPLNKSILSFKEAEFTEAIFKFTEFTECDFEGTKFINADFSHAKVRNEYQDAGGFTKSKFRGTTKFISTEFLRYANFENANFKGSTHFIATIFNGPAIFENAELVNDPTVISSPSYPSGTQFGGSTFIEDAKFSNAKFIEDVSFAGLLFNGPVSFKNSQFQTSISPFDPSNDPDHRKTKFSTSFPRTKSDFDVDSGEGFYILKLIDIQLQDKEFTIPEDCELHCPRN